MKSIYKIVITWYELSDRPLPLWLKRRCEGDETLRETLRFEESLSADLKRSGKEKRREPNPYLKDRILRAVDESERIPERNTSWWRGLTVAACACVAAALVWQFSTTRLTEVARGEDKPSQEAAIELADSEILGDWRNPLDEEIEFVVSDARGALDFVAANFLPRSVLSGNAKEQVDEGDV